MNTTGYELLEGFVGRFQEYEVTSVRDLYQQVVEEARKTLAED